MKKIKYLIITCLSIAILSYGVVAFANGGTKADSDNIKHDIITGTFVDLEDENSKIKVKLDNGVETYPLVQTIWILRDKNKAVLENLKSGDKLELVLDSSNKVAYIKAYSEAYLKAEAAIVSASPSPTATVKPEPSPTAIPRVNKPITKVKAENQVVAEEKELKSKIDYDGQHQGKDDNHHEGKDNKHHNKHEDKDEDEDEEE